MEQQMNPDAVEFAKIIDGMFDLYVKKNSNYGNSFTKLWEELGPVAGLVPLHNKLTELERLLSTGDTTAARAVAEDLAILGVLTYSKLR